MRIRIEKKAQHQSMDQKVTDPQSNSMASTIWHTIWRGLVNVDVRFARLGAVVLFVFISCHEGLCTLLHLRIGEWDRRRATVESIQRGKEKLGTIVDDVQGTGREGPKRTFIASASLE